MTWMVAAVALMMTMIFNLSGTSLELVAGKK
ncbi:MAG: hypothetical protein JWP81_213 [Ferruginibacter sp.]|nr:hypothetical protein [Ferruginibacter sp.]